MSAVAYRVSTVLFHSGASYRDLTRLNHLGVCMSPQMATNLLEKMGENLESKVVLWKRQIEENKSALLLLQEVKEKQIPHREVDDMFVELSVNIEEKSLSSYRWYTCKGYEKATSCLDAVKSNSLENNNTEDVLDEAIKKLGGEKLPYFK